MDTPNIFRYATSELSQDAFLCWLISCGRLHYGPLAEAGLAFVKALMQAGDARAFPAGQGEVRRYTGPCRISCVEEPLRQYQNIDVYFRAEVDSQKVSFVVEDKVGTQMHGDQLRRYREAIRSDDHTEDWLKLVYFKTGFVFPEEREAAEGAGYAVFNACDMLAVLDGQPARSHEIVRMYREHLTGILARRADALAKWDIDQDYVQWQLMVRLRGRLDPGDRSHMPARGRGNGGRAWTQYPRWWRGRSFFWRLDAGKAIRLMVNPRGVNGQCDWDAWDERFRNCVSEVKLDPAKFQRRRKRGGKVVEEGTVGAVGLQGIREDPDGFLDRLACLHRGFLADIGFADEELLVPNGAG